MIIARRWHIQCSAVVSGKLGTQQIRHCEPRLSNSTAKEVWRWRWWRKEGSIVDGSKNFVQHPWKVPDGPGVEGISRGVLVVMSEDAERKNDHLKSPSLPSVTEGKVSRSLPQVWHLVDPGPMLLLELASSEVSSLPRNLAWPFGGLVSFFCQRDPICLRRGSLRRKRHCVHVVAAVISCQQLQLHRRQWRKQRPRA